MSRIEEARFSRLNRVLGPGNYHRIARAVNVTPPHISRFLRGIKGTSFKLACEIADASKVSLDDLRWFIDEKASRALEGEG